MNPQIQTQRRKRAAGFTLVEVVIAICIAGIVSVSLYAGLGRSFSSLQSSRHNLRATQILTEKLEVIRLYTWTQINTPGYLPRTFSEHYQPTNNGRGAGIVYTGNITITNAPVHSAYSNTMRKVVVRLNWVSSGITRQQSMESFISQYGIQHYIY